MGRGQAVATHCIIVDVLRDLTTRGCFAVPNTQRKKKQKKDDGKSRLAVREDAVRSCLI